MLEALPVGVVAVDVAGRIRPTNDQVLHIIKPAVEAEFEKRIARLSSVGVELEGAMRGT